MERVQKQVDIFYCEQYSSEWPTSNAVGFIAWLQGKMNEAPAEYRDKVEIEITSEPTAEISIHYYRLETDEELAFRQSEYKRASEEKTKQELRLIAELKRKYE